MNEIRLTQVFLCEFFILIFLFEKYCCRVKVFY